MNHAIETSIATFQTLACKASAGGLTAWPTTTVRVVKLRSGEERAVTSVMLQGDRIPQTEAFWKFYRGAKEELKSFGCTVSQSLSKSTETSLPLWQATCWSEPTEEDFERSVVNVGHAKSRTTGLGVLPKAGIVKAQDLAVPPPKIPKVVTVSVAAVPLQISEVVVEKKTKPKTSKKAA